MKKKVKKIPKFAEGFDWQNAAGITAAATKPIANTLGIEQGAASEIANAVGDVAALIPGVGPFISAGIKTLGNFAGGAGGTDGMGNVTKSSGLTRWLGLGRSDHSVLSQANREKNAINAKTQTQHLLSDYYNNPNVPTGGTILAAEGGIMRKPVDALVSKGELIYDPTTKKLRQVPGSKGKPNKADDVFARLYEGDVVISNSPTMLMANGKTPAQNLMGMVDKYATGGTVKAREAIIKKVVNWQEANKTKPQEYAMYNGGTGYVTENGVRKHITRNSMGELVYTQSGKPYLGDINGVTWNDDVINKGRYKVEYEKAALNDIATSFPGDTRSYGYYTSDGAFNNLSDVSPQNMPDSVRTGRTFYIPIGDFNPQESYAKLNVKNDPTAGLNMKKIDVPRNMGHVKTPTQEEINAFYGYDREKVAETVKKDRNERINSKNRKYITDKDLHGGELDEVVVTAPRINKASSKKDTGKKSSSGKTTAAAPKEVKPVEINQTGLDWARQEAAKAMSQYAPNTTRPIAPGLVAPNIDPTEIVEEAALPGSGTAAANRYTGGGSNGSDWKDNLYRMAVLSQPLWDRAKAESVDYASPVYKYMPTAVDVSSQLRDADQSYALARYNFANLYPNTGAGMAAGLQAASNRAKQYADIRQWQTNAQNELIGKNVGIYNNWANEHARILNDVYNKSAQNRATARNINRQNRAAALSNWGTMLSDDKKMTMDKLKLNMLEPMLQYGYQNYDGYLKWKKSNGYE